jgi:hypothetical protein
VASATRGGPTFDDTNSNFVGGGHYAAPQADGYSVAFHPIAYDENVAHNGQT